LDKGEQASRAKGFLRLSRRERQIMDVLFRLGRATVAEVQAELPDPPSYSSVRALLRVLEEKGHIKHTEDGPRYVYEPTVSRDRAKTSALRHVMQTYFDGSVEEVVSALMHMSSAQLSDEEYQELARLIKKARKEGR